MKCFGLKFTEDILFKNWLNHKFEDLGLTSPTCFQEFEDFDNGSNLEFFKFFDKEAINYEPNSQINALMISMNHE